MGYKVANSKSYKRGKANPVGSKGLSQVLLDEMLAAIPKGKRSRFAKELAGKRNNPGYKVYEEDGYLQIEHPGYGIVYAGSIVTSTHGYGGKYDLKNLEPLEQKYTHNSIRQPAMEAANKYMVKKYGKRAKRNPPDDSDMDSASEMASKFHGREPQEIIEIDEIESYDGALAVLGDLTEMDIISVDGKSEITISFKTDRPKLCCDAEGKNMEIVGGDQTLEIEGEEHKLAPVGFVETICYCSDKHHLEDSNGEVCEYEHKLGEEGGELPMLVYDVGNGKMMLVGGSYTVEPEGIRN